MPAGTGDVDRLGDVCEGTCGVVRYAVRCVMGCLVVAQDGVPLSRWSLAINGGLSLAHESGITFSPSLGTDVSHSLTRLTQVTVESPTALVTDGA